MVPCAGLLGDMETERILQDGDRLYPVIKMGGQGARATDRHTESWDSLISAKGEDVDLSCASEKKKEGTEKIASKISEEGS